MSRGLGALAEAIPMTPLRALRPCVYFGELSYMNRFYPNGRDSVRIGVAVNLGSNPSVVRCLLMVGAGNLETWVRPPPRANWRV